MNHEEVFEAIRERSIFRLFSEEQVQALIADSELFLFESGQEITKSRHPEALYVVVQGRVAQLAPEDHSMHRGFVSQGHPLELKTVLSGDGRWSYDWVAEEPVGVLKIAKQKLMNALEAEPELLDYLLKITLNPELQRFRNDLRLCGFSALDIRKTISSLRQQEKEIEKGPSLLIVKTGGISVKHVSDDVSRELGHYISGDYLFFEGQTVEEELRFEDDTQAWFTPVADWEFLVEEKKIENFLHFLNPEEMESKEVTKSVSAKIPVALSGTTQDRKRRVLSPLLKTSF